MCRKNAPLDHSAAVGALCRSPPENLPTAAVGKFSGGLCCRCFFFTSNAAFDVLPNICIGGHFPDSERDDLRFDDFCVLGAFGFARGSVSLKRVREDVSQSS